MAKKIILAVLAAAFAAAAAACANGDSGGGAAGALRPESELVQNLCNFPAQDFSPANKLGSPRISIAEGDYAVDFTLKDASGNSHSLSEYLANKPVLLVFASVT